MYPSQLLAFGFLSLASAHCLITAASGDLGGKGTGLGVLTAKDNSQADVTVFNNKANALGQTSGVGFSFLILNSI
jgi:hypothetical protein